MSVSDKTKKPTRVEAAVLVAYSFLKDAAPTTDENVEMALVVLLTECRRINARLGR